MVTRGTSTGLGVTGTGQSIQTGFVHCGGTGPVVLVAFTGGLIPVYPFAGIRTNKITKRLMSPRVLSLAFITL